MAAIIDAFFVAYAKRANGGTCLAKSVVQNDHF
jgi:hypothetical protein